MKESRKWSYVEPRTEDGPHGGIPTPRFEHIAFSSGASMFVYGGVDNDGRVLDDMFELNLSFEILSPFFSLGIVFCLLFLISHCSCRSNSLLSFFLSLSFRGWCTLSDCPCACTSHSPDINIFLGRVGFFFVH